MDKDRFEFLFKSALEFFEGRATPKQIAAHIAESATSDDQRWALVHAFEMRVRTRLRKNDLLGLPEFGTTVQKRDGQHVYAQRPFWLELDYALNIVARDEMVAANAAVRDNLVDEANERFGPGTMSVARAHELIAEIEEAGDAA